MSARDVSTGQPEPGVRIERGDPTAEEVAAVVAVLAAASAQDDGSPQNRRRSLWNSRVRAARPVLRPGPGAWRGSALPR